jgi:hypothetical protein
MVAGVTISGYLFGAAFVALLTESQLPKREEEKEAWILPRQEAWIWRVKEEYKGLEVM